MKAIPRHVSRRRLLCGMGAVAAVPATIAAAPVARRRAGAAGKPKSAVLTVGALFPDAGPLALPGDEAFRGVLLALATARRQAPQGAKKIRLIRAGAADAAGATKAAHRLIKHESAALVLGTCSSALSFAASAVAELASVPYIELDAPADAITARGFKTLARIGLTTAELARVATGALTATVAPVLNRHHEQLRLALLFDVGATDGAFAAAMIASCAALNLPIAMTSGYGADTVDLADHVARMKRAGVDVVLHAANPDGALQFFEAMSGMAWRPRMVIGLGAGYNLSSTGFLLGNAIDGTLVVGAPTYQTNGPTAAVATLYQERFGGRPRGAASLSTYAGALPVFTALLVGHELPAALRAARQPPALLANGWGLDFNAAGQNTASFAALQKWQGGRLITIAPATTPHPA